MISDGLLPVDVWTFDTLSEENNMAIYYSQKYPLCIDPQGVFMNCVKKLELKRSVIFVTH